mmetsp:Transcript_8742/g.24434  ORF Transcript_8742/g.24434 Transcript_8742/m.24434 type:complete len:294 (+) Transcript_8742:1011-1892(+)
MHHIGLVDGSAAKHKIPDDRNALVCKFFLALLEGLHDCALQRHVQLTQCLRYRNVHGHFSFGAVLRDPSAQRGSHVPVAVRILGEKQGSAAISPAPSRQETHPAKMSPHLGRAVRVVGPPCLLHGGLGLPLIVFPPQTLHAEGAAIHHSKGPKIPKEDHGLVNQAQPQVHTLVLMHHLHLVYVEEPASAHCLGTVPLEFGKSACCAVRVAEEPGQITQFLRLRVGNLEKTSARATEQVALKITYDVRIARVDSFPASLCEGRGGSTCAGSQTHVDTVGSLKIEEPLQSEMQSV